MGRAVRRRFRDGDRLSGNQQRRDGSRTARQGSGPSARAGSGPATGRSPATAAGAAAVRGVPAPPDDCGPCRGRVDRGRRLRRRAVSPTSGPSSWRSNGPAKRREGQRQREARRAISEGNGQRPGRRRIPEGQGRSGRAAGSNRRGGGPQAAVHDRYATRPLRLARRSHHRRATPRAAGETHSFFRKDEG